MLMLAAARRAASAVARAQTRSVAAVPSLMMDTPLTLDSFFEHCERLHPTKSIVTGTLSGLHRTNYGEWAQNARRIPAVLDLLGVKEGGRVGTFAWNTHQHLELWFAVPCAGRVLHTLNIRLFPEQITYIVNHAEDEVIFVDKSLFPALWKLADTFKTVRHIVVCDDGAPGELPRDKRILLYSDLARQVTPITSFPKKDERDAASMCYTSGTTGLPKGVAYTHRSLVLHTLGIMTASGLGVSERDVILPVVPMFHANAWGLAHAAVAAGASLVLPGPLMQPKPLADLIEHEKVTVAAGVPTIWMGVLPELKGRHLPHLRAIPCGGSAVPPFLSEQYKQVVGHPIMQAWGMTETSPVATMGRLPSTYDHASEEERINLRAHAGRPLPLVDMRIVDDKGTILPWDGHASGELQCRGPWVASGYYNHPGGEDSFTADGWFCTGDVATISKDGFVKLVDRAKDLIKSGGEWIPSVDVENMIMGHPDVKEAAVVSVRSKKYMERPLAAVVRKPGSTVSAKELHAFLEPKMAKWWLPDLYEFVDEIPKTSVGKFSKKDLRKKFEHHIVH